MAGKRKKKRKRKANAETLRAQRFAEKRKAKRRGGKLWR